MTLQRNSLYCYVIASRYYCALRSSYILLSNNSSSDSVLFQFDRGEGVIPQCVEVGIIARPKCYLLSFVVDVLIKGPLSLGDDAGRCFVIESNSLQILDVFGCHESLPFHVNMLVDEAHRDKGILNWYGHFASSVQTELIYECGHV